MSVNCLFFFFCLVCIEDLSKFVFHFFTPLRPLLQMSSFSVENPTLLPSLLPISCNYNNISSKVGALRAKIWKAAAWKGRRDDIVMEISRRIMLLHLGVL